MFTKNKLNILKTIGLLAITVIFVFALYHCAPSELGAEVDGDYEAGAVSSAVPSTDTVELNRALKIANVYMQFLKSGEGQSDTFKAAIHEASTVAKDIYASEAKIKDSTDKVLQAAESFHAYLFEPEIEKAKDIDLIKTLSIDGVKCAYDSATRTFFFTMGTTPNRPLEFDFDIISGYDSDTSLKTPVFAEILDSHENIYPYGFIPELNKSYTLRAYSESYTFDYKIMFTMLPIIQISEINNIRDSYKDCVISVTDPNFTFVKGGSASHIFTESTAVIQIRGGIARSFPKKSYSLKFVDNRGENKDFTFFGMRKDSDWILDAMYIDRARSRNRVSTDVWHDMDSPLYYMKEGMNPQKNGTTGVFVEVFLNNEYAGLYCFTEKIDRKQLQLIKNNNDTAESNVFRSVIYKGKAWGQALLFKGLPGYSNGSAWWDAFEQKFPNPSFGGEIKWEPLYDFVQFFLESSDEDFAANAERYIDIQNFVEYTIFLCMTYAYDNTGKNAYWSVYDVTDENMSKLFMTPWDLDATWGRSWNGERVDSSSEWMDSDIEHDSALFRRLVLTNAGGFADKMRERWSELKGNVLSAEAIIKRFNDYFELFAVSGAWDRESEIYPESRLNLETELEFITEWTHERWAYIDNIIMNELDTVDKFAPPERRRRR